jgi:trehalose synthase
MTPLTHVRVGPLRPERFRDVLGDAYAELDEAIRRGRELFAGRVVWHVNSTAQGGGVAELLQSLLAYARGAGVDARWAVIGGNPAFFGVTKRLHNHLHGSPGDGGPLGEREREIYQEALAANAEELAGLVRTGDVVFAHDPQTAGLIAPLREAGARVVWRCHVGVDEPSDVARAAWRFLQPYLTSADAFVFSRREFIWDELHQERIWIVPPSINAFSPKNQELGPETVRAILHVAGLGTDGSDHLPGFERMDGSPGRVQRQVGLDEEGTVPADVPLVTQVSRWDRLKDPVGVLRGFVEHCDVPDAHLVLAGPSVEAVSDDPEGAEVLEEARAERAALPDDARRRVHLACVPMDDPEENAAIVNALQRRSDVVVQKSLAEGFGLTVVEAMWKGRPVVASRRGGIQDQIVHGESGLLVDDPSDLAAFGAAVRSVLVDPQLAGRLGRAARERAREHFLGSRHLIQYLRLLDELIG